MLAVLSEDFCQFVVEGFFEGERVVGRFEAEDDFVYFDGSVFLAENGDHVFGNFEPLGYIRNVWDCGTDCHYSDWFLSAFETHDSTDNCFKSGSSFFEVEHVDFVYEKEIDFG